MHYSGYILVTNKDLEHHGILGMKWGIRRYQPYPSGYTGEGKYVGDSKSDQKAAKKNVKTAIKDLNKRGTDTYQATSELNKAKMVLGEEYVNKAIKRDNVRKATMSALKSAAIVGLGAASVYAMNKSLGNYYSVSTKNGITNLAKHMAGYGVSKAVSVKGSVFDKDVIDDAIGKMKMYKTLEEHGYDVPNYTSGVDLKSYLNEKGLYEYKHH